jgi:hypothetical protein
MSVRGEPAGNVCGYDLRKALKIWGLRQEPGHARQCVGSLPSRRARMRHNVFAWPAVARFQLGEAINCPCAPPMTVKQG